MDPNTRALIMGAAGAGGAEKLYVEDVFSTFLYTGNGSTQTITNGIDLSGKGGLVWCKLRTRPYSHELCDTARGGNASIRSDTNAASSVSDIASFTSSGFNLSYTSGNVNESAAPGASWTFRKAAKFFDVVTYVGNGSTQNIVHNLGSAPGFIIIKRTDSTSNWICWHRTFNAANNDYIQLNSTSPVDTTNQFSPCPWNSTAPTSTQFSVGFNGGMNQAFGVNVSGGTYVAYLFAHDAGGFGDSGNESVVKCGSFTTDGSGNATVNLGWEPQWLLWKASSAAQNWYVHDNMRGLGTFAAQTLFPNLSNAEGGYSAININSTGFTCSDNASRTYIYIAIRRGPMKAPTDATKVFAMDTLGGTAPNPPAFNSGFPVDLGFYKGKGAGADWAWADRLRGAVQLSSTSTAAEFSNSENKFDYMDGWNTSTAVLPSYPGWMFRRAPGFFDVVAYTGTGSARTVSHNLGVAPELMIVKRRESDFWMVYTAALGNTKTLNLNNASTPATLINNWNNTSPTSAVFTVGTATDVNASGGTYVAYLFATLTGISKVGSYTGTGTTLQINCGFTAGARFVLIKRTDSTGDWYVWDTARGIVSGNDPYLLLNSTAAEVTNTDFIDPLNSGFEISSTAPAAVNANGGSFIYLAIA